MLAEALQDDLAIEDVQEVEMEAATIYSSSSRASEHPSCVSLEMAGACSMQLANTCASESTAKRPCGHEHSHGDYICCAWNGI